MSCFYFEFFEEFTMLENYVVVDAPIAVLDETLSTLKAQGLKVKVRYFNDADFGKRKAYKAENGRIKLKTKEHSTVRATKAQAKTFSVKVV